MNRRVLHKQKRALLETNIATLCRKFKVHEMEEHVLPIFKASWNEVLRTLKKNKRTVTSPHIALALIAIAKHEPFAFLEDMYFELFLAHKVVHSGKYTWNTFRVSGGVGRAGLVTASQIREAVKSSFSSLAHPPIVKVKLFGAFSWIMIILKKKVRSGTKLNQPFIFAYTPEEPYFYSSRKAINADISDGLLPFMGQRRFVDCNLSGSDIASMIKMRRNRAAKAFDAHSAQHAIAPYIPGPGVATEHGMDFTDQQLKINYANTVFGKEGPMLQKLLVREKGPNVKNIQTYRTSMTIRSKNVFEFVKRFLVRGVIVLPLTPYIERLLTLGRSTVTIERNGSKVASHSVNQTTF